MLLMNLCYLFIPPSIPDLSPLPPHTHTQSHTQKKTHYSSVRYRLWSDTRQIRTKTVPDKIHSGSVPSPCQIRTGLTSLGFFFFFGLCCLAHSDSDKEKSGFHCSCTWMPALQKNSQVIVKGTELYIGPTSITKISSL